MNIYQIKITLKNIRPPVWRRIQVPADMKLDKLHRVIQDVMGWTNSHLHQFLIGHTAYGMPDPGGELDIKNERNIRLATLVSEGEQLIYEYDFGDDWQHEVLVEKELPVEADVCYPNCLAGKRACPPEDCGGPFGYAHMLEALRDPQNPERAEFIQWLGGGLDPEAFDLDEVNRLLGKIR